MKLFPLSLLYLICTTATVADDHALTTVQGVGFVEPSHEVRRLNFQQAGVISEVLVNIGQKVTKGELLARLDDSEQRASLAIEQANVELAKAELAQVLAGINPAKRKALHAQVQEKQADNDYAHRNAARLSQLVAKQALASAEQDEALAKAKRSSAALLSAEAEALYLENYVRPVDKTLAAARLTLAQARLNQAQVHWQNTQLFAPCEGVVLEILHYVGESANAQNAEPVLLFADIEQLRVRAEIDENYALLLKVGQKATLFGRGLGQQRLQGSISLVKPLMGKKTVFTKTATERKDVDMRQVFIDLPAKTPLPIGLEVDVAIDVQ